MIPELIATILDYLPVPDMLRFARASKRMQEMVYDDTRWIQRLKSMGCWNDVEARQRFEDAMKRKLEAQRAKEAEEARRTGAMLSGSINGIAGGGAGQTLFDAGIEEERQRALPDSLTRSRKSTIESGFSPVGHETTQMARQTMGPSRAPQPLHSQSQDSPNPQLDLFCYELQLCD